jgi:hypothetical protein
MRRRLEDEILLTLEVFDDEAALGFRGPVRDKIADVQILEFIEDAIAAWPVCWEEQVIDPTCCVPPCGATPSASTRARSGRGLT